MNLTPELKSKIQELYDLTPESVHGVSLGRKEKNGQETETICIVFSVDKKLPPDQIPEGELLPPQMDLGNGLVVLTDVKEEERASLVACYTSSDPNITRLQPVEAAGPLLSPMRGGQEIIQFPTGWIPDGQSYDIEVGTLGFFCVDNSDNKIVGITNAHVVVDEYLFCSERAPDGKNTYDKTSWAADPDPPGPLNQYNPGAVSYNCQPGQNCQLVLVADRIKKYSGASLSLTNYLDVAVLAMNPNVISSSESYKIWGPIGNDDPFGGPLPFASTAEIDNLLTTNPRLFSTGRTSGPKGFTDTASCRVRVNSLGVSATVTKDIYDMPYSDLIKFVYEDLSSPGPAQGGDSGSAVVALIGSTYKIIGLLFAGSNTFGLACRIDRIAAEMNIRAWDGTYNVSSGDALGELLISKTDPRAGQTSFVHTDGNRYWQAGFRGS